jgi:DNA-binding NarL/FixJ family response regulator
MEGQDFNQHLFRQAAERADSVKGSIVKIGSHPADRNACSIPSPIEFEQGEPFAGQSQLHGPVRPIGKALEEKVILFGSSIFLRDCIQRSIESALSIPVESLSSTSALDKQVNSGGVRLLIISFAEGDSRDGTNILDLLPELATSVPIIVLSSAQDFELMRAVIGHGAKGYIPMTMGFEIAIEAVRFVLAGGTYVPVEYVLSGYLSASEPPQRLAPSGAITSRELAVVRAIRQGKPNKTIAYELNMCESTVKVHVRHIMRKLRAKNRTEVAIKALGCA